MKSMCSLLTLFLIAWGTPAFAAAFTEEIPPPAKGAFASAPLGLMTSYQILAGHPDTGVDDQGMVLIANGTVISDISMDGHWSSASKTAKQLKEAYRPMKRWLNFLARSVSPQGVLTAYEKASRFLGDWATPHGSEYGNTRAAQLFNNCVYAYCLDVFVQVARVLGKPEDEDHARRMLEHLQERRHEVVTGICLLNKRKGVCHLEAVRTQVWLRRIGPKEMEAYIRTGEPLDKAGGYGIQGHAGAFVRRIEGSYSNVVGLPTERLRELFQRYGIG